MKYVGVLVLINTVIVVAFLAQQGHDWKKLTFCGFFGCFASALIMLNERVTSVKFNGVGEISAAVAQATTDAAEIAKMRSDIEVQRDSLVMVVRDANELRTKIIELSKLAENADKELQLLRKLQVEGDSLLQSIRDLSDFSHTLVLAENDDRKAFEKLITEMESKGRFHSEALAAIQHIVQDVDPLLSVRLDPEVPKDLSGLMPDKISLGDIRSSYSRLAPMHRLKFLSALWGEERFSKFERMKFMMEVIENEKSLRALHRACVLINQEAKLNLNVLGAAQYLKWWQENKVLYSVEF